MTVPILPDLVCAKAGLRPGVSGWFPTVLQGHSQLDTVLPGDLYFLRSGQ